MAIGRAAVAVLGLWALGSGLASAKGQRGPPQCVQLPAPTKLLPKAGEVEAERQCAAPGRPALTLRLVDSLGGNGTCPHMAWQRTLKVSDSEGELLNADWFSDLPFESGDATPPPPPALEVCCRPNGISLRQGELPPVELLLDADGGLRPGPALERELAALQAKPAGSVQAEADALSHRTEGLSAQRLGDFRQRVEHLQRRERIAHDDWTDLEGLQADDPLQADLGRRRAASQPLRLGPLERVGDLTASCSSNPEPPAQDTEFFWQGAELCVRQDLCDELKGPVRCYDPARHRWGKPHAPPDLRRRRIHRETRSCGFIYLEGDQSYSSSYAGQLLMATGQAGELVVARDGSYFLLKQKQQRALTVEEVGNLAQHSAGSAVLAGGRYYLLDRDLFREAGGKRTWHLLPKDKGVRSALASPDGAWVAWVLLDEAGSPELWVTRLQ